MVHDNKIYQLAVARFEKEIDAIGREVVEAEVVKFQGMLTTIWMECPRRYKEVKCYWNDAGCYYDCLDEIAAREGWDKE